MAELLQNQNINWVHTSSWFNLLSTLSASLSTKDICHSGFICLANTISCSFDNKNLWLVALTCLRLFVSTDTGNLGRKDFDSMGLNLSAKVNNSNSEVKKRTIIFQFAKRKKWQHLAVAWKNKKKCFVCEYALLASLSLFPPFFGRGWG